MPKHKTKATEEWTTVNLCEYHAGQICVPHVEERVVRGGDFDTLTLEVRWWWINRAYHEGQEGYRYAEGSCRGRVKTCRRAVSEAGILTDDPHCWV